VVVVVDVVCCVTSFFGGTSCEVSTIDEVVQGSVQLDGIVVTLAVVGFVCCASFFVGTSCEVSTIYGVVQGCGQLDGIVVIVVDLVGIAKMGILGSCELHGQ
jgi:hypothetical protein